jgi:hypothetical protein
MESDAGQPPADKMKKLVRNGMQMMLLANRMKHSSLMNSSMTIGGLQKAASSTQVTEQPVDVSEGGRERTVTNAEKRAESSAFEEAEMLQMLADSYREVCGADIATPRR